MMQRQYAFWLIVIFFLQACAGPQQSPQMANKQARKPNIVIIFTDDQGYADVQSFGGTRLVTPNLDRMAAEGVKLTNFYVAQPVCSASRAALLTGSYPNRVGVSGAFMPESGKGLNLAETTLAELLQQAGYVTGHFGKWHLGDDPTFMPNRQGFDEFFGIPHSNDMWPHHPLQGSVFDFGDLLLFDNEEVVEALDDQSDLTQRLTARSLDFIARHQQEPFFLYLAHPQPHVPLFASKAFRGSTGAGLYADVIHELDWSVGQILTALERHGLDDNTLVIFTSDNGPWLAYGDHAGSALPFREGKGTTHEGGVREPFIARWPGQLPAGKVIDTPLMSIDLLPTIASLADAPLPPLKIDGKPAWSVLTGESDQSPHEAYFFYYGDNELQGVRYRQWKLYFPHQYQTLRGQSSRTDGQPLSYQQERLTEIALYDVQRDPGETINLAPQHPDVVARIQALADTMRADLGDSLTGTIGTGQRPIGRVTSVEPPPK